MKTNKVSIGLALVGVALHGAALTIGPVKGAAWIGRPLELSIPVLRDAQSEGETLCAEADVFYADNRQETAQVQVLQESTEQGGTVRLRVRSSALVNEPVVNLAVRVGCEQKFQRRFVLLADLPLASDPPPERIAADTAVPLVTPALADAASAPAPAPATSNAASSVEPRPSSFEPTPLAEAATTPRPTVRKPGTPRASAAPMAAPRVKPASTASTPEKPARTTGSRLQLDSLEILVERIKTLEAAAATPPPEALNKESELLLRMEGDLKSLREQTAKYDATLTALNKRLAQAESERDAAEMSYGGLAAVAVGAALIATLWQRRRAPVALPQESVDEEPEPYEAQFLRKTQVDERFEAAPVAKPPPQPEPEPAPRSTTVDVDLVKLDEPAWLETSFRAPRRL